MRARPSGKGRKRALWHVVKMRKHEMRAGVLSKKVANKGPSVRSARESVTQVTFTAVKQSPRGRRGAPGRNGDQMGQWERGSEGPGAIMDASDEEEEAKSCTLSDSETQHWSSSTKTRKKTRVSARPATSLVHISLDLETNITVILIRDVAPITAKKPNMVLNSIVKHLNINGPN